MQVAEVLEPGLYLPEAHIICGWGGGSGGEEGAGGSSAGLIFTLH